MDGIPDLEGERRHDLRHGDEFGFEKPLMEIVLHRVSGGTDAGGPVAGHEPQYLRRR